MSREKGDALESKVENALGVNKTTNSGAKFNNADLANTKVIIECKFKDIPRFKPEWKEIEKVIKQANDSGREWIYIQQNQAGTFATIDFNFLIELFNCYYERDVYERKNK